MTAPIKNLLKKYRDDNITADELRRLRRMADDSSDEDLAAAIGEDWEDFARDYEDETHARRARYRYIGVAAAVALLLASLCMTVIFYRELHATDNFATTFSSTAYQTSIIALPDGSKITMSRNSEVSCREVSFMRGDRRISFNGEGFFEIHSDASHPFVIAASGFEVVVKGTVFNLYTTPGDTIAELALVSGVVEIKTAENGTTTVQPNQKAVINRRTGVVEVLPCPDMRGVSAWQQGEIVLENASAADISSAFRRYYGVAVDIAARDSATFTGTLPVNSLPVALDVVSLALDTEVSVRP